MGGSWSELRWPGVLTHLTTSNYENWSGQMCKHARSPRNRSSRMCLHIRPLWKHKSRGGQVCKHARSPQRHENKGGWACLHARPPRKHKFEVARCVNMPSHLENIKFEVAGCVNTPSHVENAKMEVTRHVNTPGHLENTKTSPVICIYQLVGWYRDISSKNSPNRGIGWSTPIPPPSPAFSWCCGGQKTSTACVLEVLVDWCGMSLSVRYHSSQTRHPPKRVRVHHGWKFDGPHPYPWSPYPRTCEHHYPSNREKYVMFRLSKGRARPCRP